VGYVGEQVTPGSPCQNGFAERSIGSIRRECVDHLIVFGEANLRRILTKCAAYYNELRTHRSLNKDAPIHRAIRTWAASYQSPSSAKFITIIAESNFRYRQAKGERAICNWDEDTLTMGVEAARDALVGRDRTSITGLHFASTTFPFLDVSMRSSARVLFRLFGISGSRRAHSSSLKSNRMIHLRLR
jgi:hypothetical protein